MSDDVTYTGMAATSYGSKEEPSKELLLAADYVLNAAMPYELWNEPDMLKTPERWLKMMIEMTSTEGHGFTLTTFDAKNVDEMVVIKDIPFVTLCSHHLVPFIGKCHIGYVPNGRMAGLSKFARLVRYFSKGTWSQELLTRAIATELQDALDPVGVAVVMTAEHLCMTIRGVQTPGTTTTTSAMLGCFADHNKQARSEFLSLIRPS